jgi:hypothetical protein
LKQRDRTSSGINPLFGLACEVMNRGQAKSQTSLYVGLRSLLDERKRLAVIALRRFESFENEVRIS